MTTSKVLVSDKLSDAGLNVLKAREDIDFDYRPGLSEDELAEVIGEYDGLIIRSGSKVTARVLEHAEQLRAIGRAGIGVDNVDVPAASRRGVVVMNTPTGNAVTTAEHAISLLLSLARKIPQATASMRQGKWEKSAFEGIEISGKTLGVIGLGNIGRIAASRAQGLKMKVIAFDPVISSERAASLGVELTNLDDLFARADFITIHAPLTPETKGLIGTEALEKCKRGVLIVNAARGGIVDEQALADAIASGKVAGAALDVFTKEPVAADNPLLGLDAVVLTPHLGASTAEAQDRVAREIAEQVADYLRDGTITNAVNVPSLPGEAAEQLRPYVTVARRLGTLLGQLEAIDVRELRVTCSGAAGEFGVQPIAHAALAGYLERFLEGPVNPISAPYEAKERGIRVIEVREETPRRFTSSVRVTVSGEGGLHTATGTVGASGQSLLVGLDGYELDADLTGRVLIMHNDDRPGVIGSVGTVLGKREINVSRMQVGLDDGQALAVWNVDQAVPQDALTELRELANVRSVQLVKL
ncbi:MAG: phosphoglycerate dehydrogenase [Myxococcales bacterium]|nr:phosphoglycerate dehydrogenase [Myxococcales bacterium]